MAAGDTFIVDGIKYEVLTDTTKVEVIANDVTPYTGAITIPASVTYDGSTYTVSEINYDGGAFHNNANITSISITGNSLTIGELGIAACSSLTEITLSGNVIFDSMPIASNSNLEKLVINGTVSLIGEMGPFACPKLTAVEIGAGGYVGDYPGMFFLFMDEGMSSVSLKAFTVSSDNPYYTAVDGVLFNKDITTLYSYPGAKSITYTIPDTVTTLDVGSFAYSIITSITIPSNVADIGMAALYSSTLTSATFMSTVPPTLGTTMFADELTAIYVPSSAVATYKAAEGFEDYVDLIQAIPEPNYEYLKHNGKKIQVDSAYRDGAGRNIENNYVGLANVQTITGAKTFTASSTTIGTVDTQYSTRLNVYGHSSVAVTLSVGGTFFVGNNMYMADISSSSDSLITSRSGNIKVSQNSGSAKCLVVSASGVELASTPTVIHESD